MPEGPVFELEIERVRKRYRARVRRSPTGRRHWQSFSLPSDDAAGLALAGSHPRNLLAEDLSRQAGSPKDFGRHLFEKVFTGSILTAWRVAMAQEGLLLRLHLDDDPPLLKIPWELLFDPERGAFVAIERRVTRSLDLPKARLLPVPPPLRILVVLSSPPGVELLDVEREWEILDQALGERVHLKAVPPKLDELVAALNAGEWHILHFAGHGSTADEGGALILEDRQGEARAVDHLHLGTFLSHPSLRLVVLNACEGAIPGDSDAFSGVAQALLRGGVPAVLAMQQAVSDHAAISLAKNFYRALGQEHTVGSALLEARRALYRDDEPEWAIPVLYLSTPDGGLSGSALPLPWWKKWKWLLGMAVTGVLLLVVLIQLFSRSPPPSPEPEICKVPREARENPPECPSPEGLDMAFVRIEPGLFQMGQSGGAKDDEPVHPVRITEPFCIGVFEVTQEQWDLVLGNPPPDDRCLPARGIKYDAAEEFIRRLNEKDPAHPYRLPTEAEWEYVARAGTKTVYNFGDDPADLVHHANCGVSGDSFDGPAEVGRFSNPWGVYDIYGNVFEWVSDRFAGYPSEAQVDPHGVPEGTKRIRRGGSWKSDANACSSSARSSVASNRRSEETGLRIVRDIR